MRANFQYSLEVARENSKGISSASADPCGSSVVSGDNYFETTAGVHSRLLPHWGRNLLGYLGSLARAEYFQRQTAALPSHHQCVGTTESCV